MDMNVLKSLKNKLNELQIEIDNLLLEKKYCLNVYTEIPKKSEPCLYIDYFGDVEHFFWNDTDVNKKFYENNIIFKDKQSAETYKELRQDMKKLNKKFVFEEDNYALRFSPVYNEVIIGFRGDFNYDCYYYTEEDARYILDKYGQNVLKNYILYCK